MTIADRLHNKATMVAAAVAALLLSCSGSGEQGGDVTIDDEEKQGYISLSIAVDGTQSTRADNTGNPAGGSDGNGRETALANEIAISNATLFLVSTNDASITSKLDPTKAGFDTRSLNATIAYAYYFSGFVKQEGTTSVVYNSEVQKSLLQVRGGAKYYALVVVNMGDLTTRFINSKLSALLSDYRVSSPCDQAFPFDSKKSTSLRMASTMPVALTSDNGKGTREDPYLVDVSVERLAARIDFDPNANLEGEATKKEYGRYDSSLKGFCYNIMKRDGETESDEGFVLKSVIPFNLTSATMGERPFKAVLNDDKTLAYVMQETYGTDDKAKNNIADAAYGTTTRSLDRQVVFDNNGAVDVTKLDATDINTFATMIPDRDYDDGKYYIIGYPMENVPLDGKTTYVTGVLLYGDYYYGANNWDTETKKPKENAERTSRAYVYYIRHCNPNDNGSSADKMYYGIVRNNIYRLKLTRITTEKPEVDIELKVMEWNQKKHSKIYI